MSKFSADFFRGNRQRLIEQLPLDLPIAVTANGLIQRGADSAYPFSQDANFWYLTGINDPDITLVIDQQREFLIVPIREGSRVTFDGQIDARLLISTSGIKDIVNEASGWKRLDGLLARTKQVATLAPAPSFIEQYGLYSNPARSRFAERLRQHVGEDLKLVDIRSELAALRVVKQPVELDALKQAIDITTSTLKEVLAKPYGTYSNEYQIEADISHGFRRRGAKGHAFEPIVAGGARACTMHYLSNSARLKSGELVVIDVGAEVSGYAADITRVLKTAKPTKRQKDVFSAVRETQEYALSLLSPGIHMRGYETKVAKFVGLKLKQLGVTSNLKPESIRRYFPHATSHFLGLNVHDVGDYTKPLKAGSVITLEPGIYLPMEGIGVRIEDDVLITDSGAEVLSAKLPARL
ncbi:MAG: aminopeptidase P N-terminal domain-containing protein [Candidatus Saccharimonadales bacterium]